jgi:hypothetical protein
MADIEHRASGRIGDNGAELDQEQSEVTNDNIGVAAPARTGPPGSGRAFCSPTRRR